MRTWLNHKILVKHATVSHPRQLAGVMGVGTAVALNHVVNSLDKMSKYVATWSRATYAGQALRYAMLEMDFDVKAAFCRIVAEVVVHLRYRRFVLTQRAERKARRGS